MTIELLYQLVKFCFSQTDCFSLQILSQTINIVSALSKPPLYTLHSDVYFVFFLYFLTILVYWGMG